MNLESSIATLERLVHMQDANQSRYAIELIAHLDVRHNVQPWHAFRDAHEAAIYRAAYAEAQLKQAVEKEKV